MSLSFGLALIAKKLSAICWSAVEAAAKQKPVITPLESTALNKLKPVGTIPGCWTIRCVGLPSHPSMPSALTVSGRHRRAIQGFVRISLPVQHSDQVNDETLDELRVVAHEAVELRAIW